MPGRVSSSVLVGFDEQQRLTFINKRAARSNLKQVTYFSIDEGQSQEAVTGNSEFNKFTIPLL